MTSKADIYFNLGCGRCSKMATPQCKVHLWDDGLATLRQIVQSSGLTEDLKWGHPCYTHAGKNIVLIAAYNESMVLSFFKGALLRDDQNLLVRQGENTQSARVLRWTDPSLIRASEKLILDLISQAIEIEKSGTKAKASEKMPYPAELLHKFAEQPDLQDAFEKLTPGRQRAYLLFIDGAKQSQTKISRIEKWIPAILAGKGMND